jgi:hypothetical protein
MDLARLFTDKDIAFKPGDLINCRSCGQIIYVVLKKIYVGEPLSVLCDRTTYLGGRPVLETDEHRCPHCCQNWCIILLDGFAVGL